MLRIYRGSACLRGLLSTTSSPTGYGTGTREAGKDTEITSGGTPGPRLADHLAVLDNNVHGRLFRAPSLKALAETFVAAGWRARATSWTDYQVEQEWVRIEFVEPSPGEPLFSGVIDPSRMDDLGATLAGMGLRYSMELWSEDQTALLRELAG